MIDFIMKYWIEFAFTCLISLIGIIYKFISIHYKATKHATEGLKVLLKNEIIKCYQQVIEKNSITLFEKETLLDLYEEYKKLGGNGLVDDLMEQINDIPLIHGGD